MKQEIENFRGAEARFIRRMDDALKGITPTAPNRGPDHCEGIAVQAAGALTQ